MIGPSKSRPRSAQRRPSSSNKNGPSVGGTRGIRNIRKNRDPDQENAAPSNSNKTDKKSARVDAARSYLAEHVDPLMAEIINFLLNNQPEEADQAILSFLESRQNNEETKVDNSKQNRKSDSRHAILRDRQYMARTVQPVLERLMKRVVEDQPLDVEAHFIQQLKLSPTTAVTSNSSPPSLSNIEKNDLSTSNPQSKPSCAVNDIEATCMTNAVACDALYRILDEKSSNSISPIEIQNNFKKFHQIGFPLDFLATEFWLHVKLDMGNNEKLDKTRFYKLMEVVASKAPFNKKSIKLSDFLEKQSIVSSSPISVSATTTTSPIPKSSIPPVDTLETGIAVSVNYKKSGNYYSGIIKTCRPNGHYDITYDDGDSEVNVPMERIQVTGISTNNPTNENKVSSSSEVISSSTSENISLSSRVEVNYKKTGKFYPGSVAVVNSNGTFNIGYDDGDSEVNVPMERIKLLNPITGVIIPITGSATDSITSSVAQKSTNASMKPVIALVGISGAGKSTLLKAMSGDPDPKPRPTTGFSQKKLPFEVQGNEVNVHWYDLPGSWTSKWAGYLTECHGIVFVIDSSANEEDLDLSMKAFKQIMNENNVNGKPLLILANKQDVDGSLKKEEISTLLDYSQSDMKIYNSIIHPEKNGGEFDSNVEKGLEWLLDTISNDYLKLDERVKKDENEAALLAKKEKIERHRRVFTKLLQEKAFPSEGDPIETFSKVDSYEFLAMELLIHDPQVPEKTKTVDEDWGLSNVEKEVVELVGCQKMAMIMVADMINPENKKTKETHTWDEVVKYVKDRREDAGLSREI